jgi:hypothetical protein
MDLGDVDRYLKVRALADHPRTPAAEARVAKARAASMEADHFGIQEAALRVQRAMAGDDPAPQAPPSPARGWSDLFRDVAQQTASEFADRFAGEVSGAGRFEPLARGECVFVDHDCGDGQVCLEVRVLARDLGRVRSRDRIIDGVEDELIRLAEKA